MNMTITDRPDIEFRRVMDLPVSLEGEARLRASLQTLMRELPEQPGYRQDFRLQGMLLACRMRLRALQNYVAATRREEDFALFRCELRSLVEDLCTASNVLLRPLGRSIRFDAPEEAIEAACSPRDISWLVLELICNAARHARGDEIAVSLALKYTRARRQAACVLGVECAGGIDLARLHACAAREGSGASAMLRTAWLHHGALLWLEREGLSVAALRLPLCNVLYPSGLLERENPDFVELLSDPCSQVYTALGQVIGAV